jgi:NDP-sugar pyrophosphorylase family protein
LIEADKLMAFRHEGFWRPMDTLKDKQILEDLVEKGTMPWLLKSGLAGRRGRLREEDRMKRLGLADSVNAMQNQI